LQSRPQPLLLFVDRLGDGRGDLRLELLQIRRRPVRLYRTGRAFLWRRSHHYLGGGNSRASPSGERGPSRTCIGTKILLHSIREARKRQWRTQRVVPVGWESSIGPIEGTRIEDEKAPIDLPPRQLEAGKGLVRRRPVFASRQRPAGTSRQARPPAGQTSAHLPAVSVTIRCAGA